MSALRGSAPPISTTVARIVAPVSVRIRKPSLDVTICAVPFHSIESQINLDEFARNKVERYPVLTCDRFSVDRNIGYEIAALRLSTDEDDQQQSEFKVAIADAIASNEYPACRWPCGARLSLSAPKLARSSAAHQNKPPANA